MTYLSIPVSRYVYIIIHGVSITNLIATLELPPQATPRSLSENVLLPKLFETPKNNACNIGHISALIFKKHLDFEQNICSRTSSCYYNTTLEKNNFLVFNHLTKNVQIVGSFHQDCTDSLFLIQPPIPCNSSYANSS